MGSTRLNLFSATIFVAVFVAIFIAVLMKKPDMDLKTESKTTPFNYKITGFTATSFSAQGEISQRLIGQSLEHFSANQHYLISDPEATQFKKSQAQWQLKARHLHSDPAFTELNWQEGVDIQQIIPSETNERMRLQTKEIIQYPEQNLIRGSHTVSIRSIPLNSQGTTQDPNSMLPQNNEMAKNWSKHIVAASFRLNTDTQEAFLGDGVVANYE